MNNTWVKLYRKLIDNDVMHDPTALQVFIWLLLRVDKKSGETTIGRYLIAHELKINPNTAYSALKRLEKKFKIITQSSNNKYTSISLLNWANYQSTEHLSTQSIKNESKTNQKRINTIQDLKTIDVETNNNDKADAFADLKETLGIPDSQVGGITQEFQDQAMQLIEALSIPESRKSAYFKAVKDNPRNIVLDAYSFVLDYYPISARDKMFFWKLNELKKGGKSAESNPSN